MGDTEYSKKGDREGFSSQRTLSRLGMETAVDAAGLVGTVGLADGGHSKYPTWQTL